MIHDHVGAIRDPFRQDLAQEFCRNQKIVIIILTVTHINHDQTHHTRNNWLGPISFFPGDSYTRVMLFLLHLGLEGITEVDTDPKGRLVSLKVTPSNDRLLSLCPFRVQHPKNSWLEKGGRFFEGLKNYMQNKHEGN